MTAMLILTKSHEQAKLAGRSLSLLSVLHWFYLRRLLWLEFARRKQTFYPPDTRSFVVMALSLLSAYFRIIAKSKKPF